MCTYCVVFCVGQCCHVTSSALICDVREQTRCDVDNLSDWHAVPVYSSLLVAPICARDITHIILHMSRFHDQSMTH